MAGQAVPPPRQFGRAPPACRSLGACRCAPPFLSAAVAQLGFVRRHVHALAQLRKRYEHQKLVTVRAKLWGWMGTPIACTMVLFIGYAFADKFEASVLRAIFMTLGLVAFCVTFASFVCLVFLNAFDAVLHTRPRGLGRLWSVGLSSAPLIGVLFVVAYALYLIVRAVVL